jgi:hypothetical protein
MAEFRSALSGGSLPEEGVLIHRISREDFPGLLARDRHAQHYTREGPRSRPSAKPDRSSGLFSREGVLASLAVREGVVADQKSEPTMLPISLSLRS